MAGDGSRDPSPGIPPSRSRTHLHFVTNGVVEEAYGSEVESGARTDEDEEDASVSPTSCHCFAPGVGNKADGAASQTDNFTPVGMSLAKRASESTPLSTEEAERVLAGKDGLIYHAQIFADDYDDPRRVLPSGELKPRRPLPQARASAFFSALVRTNDGRWIFGGGSGGLNGWPALRNLELRSITLKKEGGVPRLRQIIRLFDAATREGSVPQTADQIARFADQHLRKGASVRVTLRAPQWTGRGWSAEYPGHCYWFDAFNPAGPRLVFGTDLLAEGGGDGASGAPARPRAKGGAILSALLGPGAAKGGASPRSTSPRRGGGADGAGGGGAEPRQPPVRTNPRATRVHMFGHRYAKAKESAADRLTWHSAVLVEWEHGAHCTVVELAWLNGLGGYGGKSNFVPDRDAERPALYDALPASLKAPWMSDRSEVRVLDVPAKSKDEFWAFLQKYRGPALRFVEPAISHSADVRLCHCTRNDLFRQLLNYVMANPRYAQESSNCQTFAADLFRHLSGNFKVEPFHPVCRPFYTSRTQDFLYTAPQGGA